MSCPFRTTIIPKICSCHSWHLNQRASHLHPSDRYQGVEARRWHWHDSRHPAKITLSLEAFLHGWCFKIVPRNDLSRESWKYILVQVHHTVIVLNRHSLLFWSNNCMRQAHSRSTTATHTSNKRLPDRQLWWLTATLHEDVSPALNRAAAEQSLHNLSHQGLHGLAFAFAWQIFSISVPFCMFDQVFLSFQPTNGLQ